MYTYGNFLKRNCEKSKKWLNESVEQGHLFAMINLSSFYKDGSACHEKNPQKAISLLKDAINNTDDEDVAAAITWLGIYYQDGIGVPANKEKALEYFKSAAELGDDYAMNNIGHAYEYGEGVDIDLDIAREWYEKSVALDNLLAQENLGRFYENGYGGLEQNLLEALRLYKLSASQNNLEAILHVGRFYEFGLGVEKIMKNLVSGIR